MDLELEFTMFVTMGQQAAIGPGPYGRRGFGGAASGEVRGSRINGKLMPGGGDWVLFGPDGYGRPDVRVQIETDDGAFILMTYRGLIEWNAAVKRATASGSDTEFTDHYWRTTPFLETGDERYAWVNQSLFVARGRLLGGGGAAYEVYRVT
jgi:hypothetical protein